MHLYSSARMEALLVCSGVMCLAIWDPVPVCPLVGVSLPVSLLLENFMHTALKKTIWRLPTALDGQDSATDHNQMEPDLPL